jgi:hypothetical protein
MAADNHGNENDGKRRQPEGSGVADGEGRRTSVEINQSSPPAGSHVKDHGHEHRHDRTSVQADRGQDVAGQDSGRIGPASMPGTRAPTPNQSNGPPTLVCPICTDEFIRGEDVRLLPCNHKFHPDCIDPWLVNVSGTCPLW